MIGIAEAKMQDEWRQRGDHRYGEVVISAEWPEPYGKCGRIWGCIEMVR
jgi:hypothetical protein